ncbi:uncharacterized protein LOC124285819 [Haliotis rubra]|uniref:uncharacterized protein LOC124285819 n=1 Tax=Haliotis rubra TaxID=36100 RepID=UPI001EE57B50|nr:uncharacterized protein LOC124285819 [Haliotis rubra]
MINIPKNHVHKPHSIRRTSSLNEGSVAGYKSVPVLQQMLLVAKCARTQSLLAANWDMTTRKLSYFPYSERKIGPWLRRQTLGGMFVFRTTTASGTFLLVANERARVEGGCTSDGLGPVIQRPRQRFNFFAPANTRPGVIAEVTLQQNREITIDVASVNMPFDDLERYSGIGLALCTGFTTDAFGRQVCTDPVFACCKVGYDNQDAVLLPIP